MVAIERQLMRQSLRRSPERINGSHDSVPGLLSGAVGQMTSRIQAVPMTPKMSRLTRVTMPP